MIWIFIFVAAVTALGYEINQSRTLIIDQHKGTRLLVYALVFVGLVVIAIMV